MGDGYLMPTLKCPLEGFEHVTVELPNEWTLGHLHLKAMFYIELQEKGRIRSTVAEEAELTFKLAKVSGFANEDIHEIPLSSFRAIKWVNKVIISSIDNEYDKVISPPNQS